MAAYWRIAEARVLDDHAILVRFTDGLEGVVRFSPDFFQGVFSHLCDPVKFREVAVVDGAVTWPGGLDLAPDAMYQDIKLHGEQMAGLDKETKDAVRKPGTWSALPKAKADWDSSNTNEDIALTLSGDGE
jgi:hypothetical protein